MEQPRKNPSKTMAIAMRFGVQLVVTTLVGAGLGYWLDGFWGSRPWLMVVGLLLGAVAGFRDLYRLVKDDLKQDK